MHWRFDRTRSPGSKKETIITWKGSITNDLIFLQVWIHYFDTDNHIVVTVHCLDPDLW